MIFGKSNLTKVAASLFGSAIALVGLLGCGGETGGAPSGIGGALTNAKVRVSSFNLATTVPVDTLEQIDGVAASGSVTGIDGTLYPTRNSHSFRVLLKGAGSNREDVKYYYDAYEPDRDPTVAGHTVGPDDYVVHPPTKTEPWDLTVAATTKLPRTELRRVFFAKRAGHGNQVVAVFKLPEVTPASYIYEEDGAPVDKTSTTIFEAKGGAFSYSQSSFQPSVRTGRRNVIVQFFSSDADETKTKFDEEIPASTDPGAAETTFLGASLTNSYVFTTDIPSGKQDISLTSSFQANNGDNGLVDSGDLTLVARNLPARWGSVKFEAYEESYGFGKPSIVFTKIVNLTDVQHAGVVGTSPSFEDVVAKGKTAPTYVSAKGKDAYDADTDTQKLPDPSIPADQPDPNRGGFPFPNRQRVLRVYATCYELPDATGAILAQTQENGSTYNDAAGKFPVQFIVTPQATADTSFFPNPGPVANEAAAQLQNMVLTSSISNVAPQVPAIKKDGEQTITVTATSIAIARFAYNDDPGPPYSTTLSRTLSNTGFVFKLDTDATHTIDDVTFIDGVLNVPALPNAAEPGELQWPGTSTVEFSQATYSTPTVAARIKYVPYYAGSPSFFAAPLLPTQGTGGGVIRGVKR